MKQGRRMSADAPERDRVIELYKRLYGGILPRALNPETYAGNLPSMALDYLYAGIGRKLALKENEFSPGSGRKLGAKIKSPSNDLDNVKKREYRDHQKRIIIWRNPATGKDEEIELEPGVSLEPPWKRVRTLETVSSVIEAPVIRCHACATTQQRSGKCPPKLF